MTAAETVRLLYVYLLNSGLKEHANAPTGNITKYTRLANSTLEDVVVKPLTGQRYTPVQESVILVNLYVPNLRLQLPGGVVDQSQPNAERFEYLAELLSNILAEFWSFDGRYGFEVEQDNGPFEDKNNQHFISFRVRFYSQLNNN